MSGVNSSTGGREFLTFSLAAEEYALALTNVRSVIEPKQLTQVPWMPRFVRGVVNLRGALIPVIDLSQRFGWGETKIAQRASVLILEQQSNHSGEERLVQMGLIVESVGRVTALPDSAIAQPPSFGTRIPAEYLSGVGSAHGRFLLILDAARALAVPDLLREIETYRAGAGAAAGWEWGAQVGQPIGVDAL